MNDELELCEYCGETPEDCANAEECNYGIAGYEDDTCVFCNGSCHCDAAYDNYRDLAAEYDEEL